MIAKMNKVFVVTPARSREAMLEALRTLGVVHLEPLDPKAAAPEELRAALEHVRRARQAIAMTAPAGAAAELEPADAVREILQITRRTEENRNRLNALGREAGRLGVWGELRREQLEALAEAGVALRFFSVPVKQFDEVVAECVVRLTELPGKRVLVGLVHREGQPSLPDTAQPVEPPPRDLPTVRAEAKAVDEALAADAERLAELANLAEVLQTEEAKLTSEAQFAAALAGAMRGQDLFAVQGWAPVEAARTLSEDLARLGIAAGVDDREPAEEEEPPTLIRYPRWVQPIKGLFDMLGTLPGYREYDLSPFFMVALPIFAAMLIGDAGYGLLFVLVPALIYAKATAAAGKPGVHLVMFMGFVTIAWGVLAGVYFGVAPDDLLAAGGALAGVGKALGALQLIRGDVRDQAYMIMKISFVMAGIHLSVAQVRQALALAPRLEMLSKIGWAVFLWGMFLLIWYLFFVSQAGGSPHWLTPYLLAVGAGLAILFASPSRNPLRMLGLGLAQFPLSALATFSDSLSYIRLMGVGLASTIIGRTFNGLGAQVASAGTWLAGAPVVLFGHGLNIAMCMIAILAHGVRLNMLEFSNNAGVQWAGYAYHPFARSGRKE
ncbi:MAG: hypothetical protein AMJ81_01770 [Phycisphaerae bacterium SM23_33]|nr:MAG: hypothetical protein AMJ81_01770 [Phycisphaerae bacterium SM23_33]